MAKKKAPLGLVKSQLASNIGTERFANLVNRTERILGGKNNSTKIRFIQQNLINVGQNLLKDLHIHVVALQKKPFDSVTREKFYETWYKMFKGRLDLYEHEIMHFAVEEREISAITLRVESAEAFEDAFYDVIWPVLPVRIAYQVAAQRGRLIDPRHSTDLEIPKELKGELLGEPMASAIKHAMSRDWIVPGNGNRTRKITPKVGRTRKGVFFEALWPREDYLFPQDGVLFNKVNDLLKRGAKKGINSKWDGEHGPSHVHAALKHAEDIIARERLRKVDPKLNIHQIYLMIGFHDFWRACDIDPAIYHLGMRKFFSRKEAAALSGETQSNAFPGYDVPDVIGGRAIDHYADIQKELEARLTELVDQTTVATSSYVDVSVSVMRNFNEIGQLIRNTLKTTKEKIEPTDEEKLRLIPEIRICLNEMKAAIEGSDLENTGPVFDSMQALLDNMKARKNLKGLNTTFSKLKTKLEDDVISPAILAHLQAVNDAIQDLTQNVTIKRARTLSEIKALEDTAIARLDAVEGTMKAFDPEHYDLPPKQRIREDSEGNKIKFVDWKKEFALIRQNILQRRKVAKASSTHMFIGGGGGVTPSLKAAGIDPKFPVAPFLDMLGYPFKYPEVMSFIKIHDFKFITPDTLEGQIAQDADMMDGIGPAAVERTFKVGLGFNNKYFLPSKQVSIDQRFQYFLTGRDTPDTMSVILVLCYCWPACLNTDTAKKLVEQKGLVKAMEKQIIDFSRRLPNPGLTETQIVDLKKVMRQMKAAAPKYVEKMKKEGPESVDTTPIIDRYLHG